MTGCYMMLYTSVDACNQHWIHWIISPRTVWPPEKLAKFLPSSTSSLAWQISQTSPGCRQIIKVTKPRNTDAFAGDQSTRVFCHRGHDVTQQNHGLLGCQEIYQPDSLDFQVVFPCLVMDFLTSSKLVRGSPFPPLAAWKSVLLPKQLCHYVYVQLRSPYLATLHVQSFQSSSLVAAP